MDARYQIFVSSTFRDLQTERREVIQALLEMDCIPAGMELFPATDDDAWSLIQTVIDQSDYYCLVVGGRYGSATVDGISYTEREYDFAYQRKKPIAAFLHGDPGKIPLELSEMDPKARQKLDLFRAKVESHHHCKYWLTSEDLGGKVARAVNMLIKSKPTAGWVRAGQASPELMASLEKARGEISDLKAQIAALNREPPRGAEDLANGSELCQVACMLEHRRTKKRKLHVEDMTWDDILRGVGPKLEVEVSDTTFRTALSNALQRRLERRNLLDTNFSVKIDVDSYNVVQYQLVALGLITVYIRERNYGPDEQLYTLSPLGRQQLYQLVAIKSSQGHLPNT